MADPLIFGLPPGADFPADLVAGLRQRLAHMPPEAMAAVTLFVNTARMRRRVEEAFQAGPPGLLPRIRLVTDLAAEVAMTGLPAAIPPLRRRLELTQLISGLLDRQPDIAPRAALYDLADSLATLMDEMQGEGIRPEALAALDVSAHSAHWARTQDFLRIISPFFSSAADPDPQARQRLVVERLIARWQDTPPAGPVIVAGTTGSRGTTLMLMQAVARLPQGVLVLPGFDFDMPQPAWDRLEDALTAEDHPQFRFRRLLDALGLDRAAVQPWPVARVPDAGRNRLISLALRPAPVTDQWRAEGATLPDLGPATARMTLIEAPSPRAEALAIALILRHAAETGTRAALVTPDRTLARLVTAALDRWGIRPDDSAGRPLSLSAPGRFLRHVARLFGARLTAESLLVILKHPLAASGADRGPHLRRVRELELYLRRKGPAFLSAQTLVDWAVGQTSDPGAEVWARALGQVLSGTDDRGALPLVDHVARHRALAEALARGDDATGSGALWDKEPGLAALAAIDELAREASHGGSFTPADYADLFDGLMSGREVRETVAAHPGLMIRGTVEARIQGADLVILGGLCDGTWPALPVPDPWLNRQMRKEAGLLLPERQIGLSAHDWQQAIGAPEVVLSRAIRDAEAETVPSRWLNRLLNLMGGLADQGGPAALALMRARGAGWVTLAAALDAPLADTPAAHRPSPRPPVAARPRELPLTRISRLIRDPYEIYARYVLRLRPLDALRREPDARLRGVILHGILEQFVKTRPDGEGREAARARLLATTAQVLDDQAPWPAARALWLARVDRAADFFLASDAAQAGVPVALEAGGRMQVTPGFALFGTPDRIDRLPDGRLHLIDYKTGSPPTEAMQKSFDKQLLLAAAMAERGGFPGLDPTEVARISYVGLGSTPKSVDTEMTPEITGAVWEGLQTLIAHYHSAEAGFTARRAVFEDRFPGDYDHLSRFGEWEMTDLPHPEDVP